MASPGSSSLLMDTNTWFESILGYGGQAVVWKITRLVDQESMALKLFNKAPSGRDLDKQVERLKRVCKAAREIAEALPDAQVCFPRAIYNEHGEFGVLMGVGERNSTLGFIAICQSTGPARGIL